MAIYNVPIDGLFTVQAQTPEEAQRYAAGWIFYLVDGLKERQIEQGVIFPIYHLQASSEGYETKQGGSVAGAPPAQYREMTEPGTEH